MIALSFSKAQVASFVASLSEGRAIDAPAGGWSRSAALSLAGACYFLAVSHGPTNADQYDSMPFEHQEAVQQKLFLDLSAAVRAMCAVAMSVNDGEYNERYEENVQALVAHDDNEPSSSIVQVVKGLKITS